MEELAKGARFSRILWLVALLQQIVSATQGTRGQMEKHVQFAMEVHLKKVRTPELAKSAPLFRLLQLAAKY